MINNKDINQTDYLNELKEKINDFSIKLSFNNAFVVNYLLVDKKITIRFALNVKENNYFEGINDSCSEYLLIDFMANNYVIEDLYVTSRKFSCHANLLEFTLKDGIYSLKFDTESPIPCYLKFKCENVVWNPKKFVTIDTLKNIKDKEDSELTD